MKGKQRDATMYSNSACDVATGDMSLTTASNTGATCKTSTQKMRATLLGLCLVYTCTIALVLSMLGTQWKDIHSWIA